MSDKLIHAEFGVDYDASNIRNGDAIVVIESPGIHANGLTLAVKLVQSLPDGYRTKMEDGRTYGEAFFESTIIYAPLLVKECLNRGINIHYAVNIMERGWSELMRPDKTFSYVIERLPKCPPIFDLIQKYGPVDDREAFSKLGMGAGLALYVSQSDVDTIVQIAGGFRLGAYHAGHIEQSAQKKVVIRPKKLEYSAETLGVR